MVRSIVWVNFNKWAPTDSDRRNPEPMHVSNPRHPSILPLLWSSRVFKNKSSWDVWLWLFHIKPGRWNPVNYAFSCWSHKACCTAGEWYLTFKNPWRHPHASGTHQIQIYHLPRGCNFNTSQSSGKRNFCGWSYPFSFFPDVSVGNGWPKREFTPAASFYHLTICSLSLIL